MPLPLYPTGLQTSDAYTDQLSLGPAAQLESVLFTVANAEVLVQVAKLNRDFHAFWDLTEEPFSPGQWGFDNICGIRFRSAAPGVPAVITATGYYKGDVVPQGTGISSATAVSYEIVRTGKKVNNTPGIPVQVQQSVLCAGILLRAKPGNSGLVYLGMDTNVGAPNGLDVSPGDYVGLQIGNTNQIYFDVQNSGDGISWLAVG